MIDWAKTEQEFGVNQTNYKFSSTVAVICDGCGTSGYKKIRLKKNVVNGDMPWRCMSCCLNNPVTRAKKSVSSKKMWRENRDKIINSIDRVEISRKSKENWQKEEYRNKVISAIRKNATSQSEHMKQKWLDKEYRNKMMKLYSTSEWSDLRSKIASDAWNCDEYREKIAAASKRMWEDPDYKCKMSAHRSNQHIQISSIQNELYSILDDLGIEYYRERDDGPNDPETIIGPYRFDCAIQLSNKKLLIECQGDYWHALNKTVASDTAKATYIARYHPDCEIKYLWEHEFKCKNKIIELIKYWVGLTNIELIDYDFNDISIRECLAKDYKLLLSKYHYLPNAGRGGMAHGSHGAYLGGKLIAVCVFGPLVRQNLPWDNKAARELSRLCIHPRYQKKNFASWFVSRCIKLLDPKYRTIISYCDTTFNHDGAIYKACNFRLDGEVKPDYWYAAEGGWVMHKKTLYNQARKMSLSEKEFATLYGYRKIYGNKKLRFVYER